MDGGGGFVDHPERVVLLVEGRDVASDATFISRRRVADAVVDLGEVIKSVAEGAAGSERAAWIDDEVLPWPLSNAERPAARRVARCWSTCRTGLPSTN